MDYSLFFSTLIFGKLLVLWATVLLADHFLDFRFEYLWPVWVFVRSVYDSFKYQGMVRLPIFFKIPFICSGQSFIFLFTSTFNILGLLSIFRMHFFNFGHDVLLFHPYAMAFLPFKHLCMVTLRVADR